MAYNPDYDGPDPNAGGAPPPLVAAPEGQKVSAIQQWYQQYLGRQASLNDVNSWLANPGGLSAIEQGIKSSPEAQAYAKSQTPTTPTTPTTPPPTNTGTPPPAAATDYDFNQARANIERGLGRPLTDAEIAAQFAKRGGNIQGRFNDATVAAVVADLKGAGSGPPPTAGTGNGAPKFDAPGYTPPPGFSAPPAFSYADFSAPDPNDLQNDPWTKYTLKSQQDAIQKGAAAKGILNTGGTINDLLVNAADVNSQGYQSLWNRKMGEYTANRGNAFDAYKTNYGISKDVYDTNTQTQYKDPFQFGYQGALDSFNSQIHNFDQNQYYAQHNKDQDLATGTHNSDLNRQYDWYKTLFTYQQGEDEWARKFKLLGLI